MKGRWFERFRRRADRRLTSMVWTMIIKRKGIRKVHLSIDDVFLLPRGENRKLLSRLLELNLEYGIKADLYVMYRQGGECLELTQQSKGSFQKAAFLRWGPHQAEYLPETYSALKGLSLSGALRMHFFSATRKQLDQVGKNITLLCADSRTRVSYGLSPMVCRRLDREGTVAVQGRHYRKTDLRLEKPILPQLLAIRHRDGILSLFTHEDRFEDIFSQLQVLCAIFKKAGIEFI